MVVLLLGSYGKLSVWCWLFLVLVVFFPNAYRMVFVFKWGFGDARFRRVCAERVCDVCDMFAWV